MFVKKVLSSSKWAMSALVMVSASSALATTYYNYGTGNDGQTYCYASDANGNVFAGEPAVAPNICSGGFTAYSYGTGANGLTYCYASDVNGNVNAGEPAVDPSICE